MINKAMTGDVLKNVNFTGCDNLLNNEIKTSIAHKTTGYSMGVEVLHMEIERI